MDTSLPAIRVALLVWISAACLAFSQGNTPAPGGARRLLMPNPNANTSTKAAKPLSSNYRITFAGKCGEQPIGELSSLTCSPVVYISGPLDASTTPTSFDVKGSVSEREGGLIFFEYQIGFQVPVTMSTHTTTPKGDGPGTSTSTVQYQNHTCSGSILMKPSKAYEILKAGGCTHAVMITPEGEVG